MSTATFIIPEGSLSVDSAQGQLIGQVGTELLPGPFFSTYTCLFLGKQIADFMIGMHSSCNK